MTTNHPEILDEALIRPGRVDYVSEFKLASKVQAKKMFLKFYPKEKGLAIDIETKMQEDKYSMAQLQGHFMTHKDDSLKALQSLDDLTDQSKQFQPQEEDDDTNNDKKSNHSTPTNSPDVANGSATHSNNVLPIQSNNDKHPTEEDKKKV